jgi:hypothetical protein
MLDPEDRDDLDELVEDLAEALADFHEQVTTALSKKNDSELRTLLNDGLIPSKLRVLALEIKTIGKEVTSHYTVLLEQYKSTYSVEEERLEAALTKLGRGKQIDVDNIPLSEIIYMPTTKVIQDGIVIQKQDIETLIDMEYQISQIKAVGQETIVELHQQEERLLFAAEGVGTVKGNLRRGARQLRTIGRGLTRDKLTRAFCLLVMLAIIAVIVVYGVYK